MKRIKKFEEVIASENVRRLSDHGINGCMFWAYRRSQEAGCKYLNFGDVIEDYDVAPIVEACQEAGIKTITISSTFSGLVETLYFFDELGCKIKGMTSVPAGPAAFNSERTVPALVLSIPGNK